MILVMISNCERVRVHSFKKIQDWILESEGIRKWIFVSLLDRSIQDLSDHGASKELKNPLWKWILPFSDSFGFKIPILNFLKEKDPNLFSFLGFLTYTFLRFP